VRLTGELLVGRGFLGASNGFLQLLNNAEKSVSGFKPVCIQPKQPDGDCSTIMQDCSQHNINPKRNNFRKVAQKIGLQENSTVS